MSGTVPRPASRALWFVWLPVLVLLAAADATQTTYALSTGAFAESNPALLPLIGLVGVPAALVAVQVVFVAAMLGLPALLRRRGCAGWVLRLLTVGLVGVVAVKGYVVVSNQLLLLGGDGLPSLFTLL